MTEGHKRFEDTIWGKVWRFWPLIVALISMVSWISALGESVKLHHILDETRCIKFENDIAVNGNRITRLEEGYRAILANQLEFKGDVKEILKRLPH